MYTAPLQEFAFILDHLLGADALADCPAYADYSSELAAAVLAESAKFAESVLAPLNQSADREGAHWSENGVRTATGLREAYRQFQDGGWPQLRAKVEDGGQGAPLALATAVQETWAAANLAFKLCPMLTYGATHALTHCASDELRSRFLPRMVTGEWSGTMVLTEPQAGSDLSLIRTRAVAQGDHHLIFGHKIFITWGEHDLTDNIIHLVLARLENAPPGVRGISLFVVPKVLVNEDGSPGRRNDVYCTGLEHKLGIHASPTCTLSFGERDGGAIGYLVGEAHQGLAYMFVMMNAARLSVGLQGYAVADRAFQLAADYARGRMQGSTGRSGEPVAIIGHPDVKRMLLTMKAGVQAMRQLTLYAAWQLDLAAEHQDAGVRAAAQARGDLLIPIVKGWCTEFGAELASLGMQVHGGMGYIEDTGAAQLLRDVRITSIYEGTTGIQANDLFGRKLARDKGAVMAALLAEARAELATPVADAAAEEARAAAAAGIESLQRATVALLQQGAAEPERALAVVVPYLMLAGYALGGWLMARAARLAVAAPPDVAREFCAAKLASARFYAVQLLPRVAGLLGTVQQGGAAVSDVSGGLV